GRWWQAASAVTARSASGYGAAARCCAASLLRAGSSAVSALKRSLRLFAGLAMVVGIMVGSGIFRTPGIIAARLGRPWLTFVAWMAGGALAFLGALAFAELATRHPKAGGKYVYSREAFGPRAGFVVGWVEALGGVVVMAFAKGTGAGWHGALPDAPPGAAVWPALAVAFQSVLWTYYGYPDAAKIAEEVVDPGRTLPRVFLGGIAISAALYLLLNAAFLSVLSIDQVASSKLVAADVATAIFGARGGAVIAA